MIKIPSTEERVEKLQGQIGIILSKARKQNWKNGGVLEYDPLDLLAVSDRLIIQALTADRTALLTELRETIQAIDFYGWNEQTQSKIKEKVQAHINNLINPR